MNNKVLMGALPLLMCPINQLQAEKKQQERPNIILILADDMGFSDLGCMGSGIETPNVDKLANNGVVFSQFYNTGRSCPTRASLLTGLYAHQTGLGWMTSSNLGHSGYTGDMNNHAVTIAQVLKEADYACYMTGKWHVTYDKFMSLAGPKHNWPIQRGFDRFFGHLTGGGSYYSTPSLTNDNEQRKSRYDHLRATGIIHNNCILTERDPQIPAWETLTNEEKKLWDARMAVYAAQIDCMDQGIGEVILALANNNALDNTLIVFLSDNGGNAEGQGSKTLTEEEILLLGNENLAQSYRINWANVSDVPFREYKYYVHEGGIATPLIAYWPGKIKQTGMVSKQVGHVIDLMPTFMDIANASYPETYQGHTIHPLTGKSLLPTILKGKTFSRQPLFFEHEANRAVIAEDWKLVSAATNTPPYVGKWELYNLKKDRSETNDLITKYPKKAHELAIQWDQWAQANHVYPLDNSGGKTKLAKDQGPPLHQ